MRSPAVQFVLIALALLSAFTLPHAKSGVRNAVQALFVPVSLPTRGVVRWATERVRPGAEADALSPTEARDRTAVLRQNAQLVTQIARLEAQVDRLKHVAADQEGLGRDLQNVVRPAAVIGGSPTGRQTLLLNTATASGVRDGAAVIHPGGFVGRIYAVATGGTTANVLLASDVDSKLLARFVRLTPVENGVSWRPIELNTQPLVEGNGRTLVVRLLPAADVRGVLQVGDTAVLDDPHFPAAVQGQRLGVVRRVNLPPTDAGHATIELEPTADLGQLREVLVVTR